MAEKEYLWLKMFSLERGVPMWLKELILEGEMIKV